VASVSSKAGAPVGRSRSTSGGPTPAERAGSRSAGRTDSETGVPEAARPRTLAAADQPDSGTTDAPTGAAGTTTEQPPPIAADDAAKGATMGKPADTKTTATKSAGTAAEAKATRVAPKTTRSAAETEKIRVALGARREELQTEYHETVSEITELQRDRLTDSAGDDQADTGTKTFEREQEISLANGILERITQVERALERLDDGSYGWCERCGNPIPVERLAAFPSATLCVTCKQLEERR
jgi:RNA polymerase-binding protein DksA